MSLNELVSVDYKPWLNVRSNNVIIDGDLKSRGALQGYILGYGGNGNVSFTPPINIVDLSVDAFGLVPIQNANDGKLDFELGPVTENNFSLNASQNIVCENAGIYMLLFKFTEAGNPSSINNRPNPFLEINSEGQQTLSLRVCIPNSTFSSYSGYNMTGIFSLNVNDVLSIYLDVVPTGTINMMDEYFASNLILVKIA